MSKQEILIDIPEPLFLDAQAQRRKRRSRLLRWIVFTMLAGLLLVRHVSTHCKKQTSEGIWTEEPSQIQGCSGPRRTFKRHETFLPIQGSFSLYDELDLSTIAGPINVIVYPQSGCGPSVLNVHSTAGAIDIVFASPADSDALEDQKSARHGPHRTPSAFAARENTRAMMVNIATKSGSIKADLTGGSGSSISMASFSGTIEARFHISGGSRNDSVTSFHTSTTAGSQYISVLSSTPYSGKKRPVIDGLEASHTVRGSGYMKLNYPRQWHGNLHVRVDGAGLVDVSGDDLQYFTKTDREVLARRGNGGDHARTIDAVTKGAGSIAFNADGTDSFPASY